MFEGEVGPILLAFGASAIAAFVVMWGASFFVELTIESILTFIGVELVLGPLVAGIAGGLVSRTVLGVAGTLLGTWLGWLVTYLVGGTELDPAGMVLPALIIAVFAVVGHLGTVMTVGLRRRP